VDEVISSPSILEKNCTPSGFRAGFPGPVPDADERAIEAISVTKQLLEENGKRLSQDHLLILNIKSCLADFYRIAQDFAEAEKLQIHVVEKRT
jgi:hypothetical protein